MLNEGRPLAFGSYDELTEKGIDFMSLIKEEKEEKGDRKRDDSKNEELLIAEQIITRKRTISTLSTHSEVSPALMIG